MTRWVCGCPVPRVRPGARSATGVCPRDRSTGSAGVPARVRAARVDARRYARVLGHRRAWQEYRDRDQDREHRDRHAPSARSGCCTWCLLVGSAPGSDGELPAHGSGVPEGWPGRSTRRTRRRIAPRRARARGRAPPGRAPRERPEGRRRRQVTARRSPRRRRRCRRSVGAGAGACVRTCRACCVRWSRRGAGWGPGRRHGRVGDRGGRERRGRGRERRWGGPLGVVGRRGRGRDRRHRHGGDDVRGGPRDRGHDVRASRRHARDDVVCGCGLRPGSRAVATGEECSSRARRCRWPAWRSGWPCRRRLRDRGRLPARPTP